MSDQHRSTRTALGGLARGNASHAASARLKIALDQAIELARDLEYSTDNKPLTVRLMQLISAAENSTESPTLFADVQSVLTALQQQLTQTLNEQDSLRQRLTTQQRLGRNNSTELVRQTNESLRRLWDDGFSALETDLSDRFRSRLLPMSLVMNRIQNLCEDLSSADLSSEQLGRNVRVQLNADARRQAEQLLQRSLRQTVEEDVAWLNQRFDAVVHETREELRGKFGIEVGEASDLGFEQLSAANILVWLQPQLALMLKYAGEIPHRTLLDRLSHGRRPVFALMMVLSLVGAAFGYGRGMTTLLAPLILVLFLGGTAWTFHSFREERDWLLERELTRLRDVVGNECRRHIEELLKEWSSRAIRWLRDQQKSLQRQVDDLLRQSVATSEASAERNRLELQDQIRTVEQRHRELTQLDQRLTHLCENGVM